MFHIHAYRAVCLVIIATLALISAGAGCAGRPSLIPNADKSLRKSSAQLAADAAKRHPYKSDAPRGGEAAARATVGYMLDQVDVVNLSQDEWTDVEVWVNQNYVVHLPKMERSKLKTIPFRAMYDDKGKNFPTDNSKTLVKKIEILRDGKVYDVPVRLGD